MIRWTSPVFVLHCPKVYSYWICSGQGHYWRESLRESLWFPVFLASCEVCCCSNCEFVFKVCLCLSKSALMKSGAADFETATARLKELLSELQEFHFLAVCCAFVLTASCFVLVWDETLHLGPQSVNDIMWVARRWSNLNLTFGLMSSQMKVSLSLRQVKWWRFPSVCSFLQLHGIFIERERTKHSLTFFWRFSNCVHITCSSY